ncbi:MAG: hypothetical protein F4X14_10365 [Caldilineaceae bacterium SB0661_bin_32]|uniref:Uncharacterized protein n=1 Tax=Caldilineaceae bacterium SB0661_bin_32 TaxID=2605255 RepID=A0A6B1D7R8_9CHLR|nr:hypothetical protein [Caldilineaceae bacterium SB0661_bin_32]
MGMDECRAAQDGKVALCMVALCMVALCMVALCVVVLCVVALCVVALCVAPAVQPRAVQLRAVQLRAVQPRAVQPRPSSRSSGSRKLLVSGPSKASRGAPTAAVGARSAPTSRRTRAGICSSSSLRRRGKKVVVLGPTRRDRTPVSRPERLAAGDRGRFTFPASQITARSTSSGATVSGTSDPSA